MKTKKKCTKCNNPYTLKTLELKMGGLICPKCRVILYYSYVDKEWELEHNRRKKELK